MRDGKSCMTPRIVSAGEVIVGVPFTGRWGTLGQVAFGHVEFVVLVGAIRDVSQVESWVSDFIWRGRGEGWGPIS